MRQRNDSDYPMIVNVDPPVLLLPGDELDAASPVIGLTPVTEEVAPPAAPVPAKGRRATTTDTVDAQEG